jgi:hypothetical protein
VRPEAAVRAAAAGTLDTSDKVVEPTPPRRAPSSYLSPAAASASASG